jgi:putative membrane protein (TIGR04086 family)
MGKKAEKRQFLWGLFVGLGYFGILLTVSFLGNNFYLGDIGKTILVFFLCSFSGMFGGMLS